MDQLMAHLDTHCNGIVESILDGPSCTWPMETVERLLLRKDFDINLKLRHDLTVTARALRSCETRLIKILDKRFRLGLDKDRGPTQSLLSIAAANGYDLAVKFLLSLPKVDVNEEFSPGTLPLFASASEGSTRSVQHLLNHPGIDVNKKSKHLERTALSVAAERGHLKIVQLLLQCPGIDINTRDCFGQTPLYLSSHKGYNLIVELLLSRPKIRPGIADFTGRTALWTATRYDEEWARGNRLGVSHIHRSPSVIHPPQGSIETVLSLLLSRPEIDVNQSDSKDRNTPLMNAARSGKLQWITIILQQAKVDLNAVNSDGETAMGIALSHRDPSVAKLLLMKGAGYKGEDGGFDELAYHAARYDYYDLMKAILRQYPDVSLDERDELDRTAIWHAADNNSSKMVHLILSHGANIDILDKTKQKPIDIASRKKYHRIEAILREAESAPTQSISIPTWAPRPSIISWCHDLKRCVSREPDDIELLSIGIDAVSLAPDFRGAIRV